MAPLWSYRSSSVSSERSLCILSPGCGSNAAGHASFRCGSAGSSVAITWAFAAHRTAAHSMSGLVLVGSHCPGETDVPEGALVPRGCNLEHVHVYIDALALHTAPVLFKVLIVGSLRVARAVQELRWRVLGGGEQCLKQLQGGAHSSEVQATRPGSVPRTCLCPTRRSRRVAPTDKS